MEIGVQIVEIGVQKVETGVRLLLICTPVCGILLYERRRDKSVRY